MFAKHIIRRIERIEEALKWIGVMQFTGHFPSLHVPEIIADALEEYKRQHPDEHI